jgi:hypothetical protein
MEDPDLFEWPLEDPLLCVAIAFMRKYANRWTDKVRERLSLTDDNDEPTDWWKGSGLCGREPPLWKGASKSKKKLHQLVSKRSCAERYYAKI